MGKGDANCVHEQVAKADCECPLHYSSTIIKIIALHFHLDYNMVCNSGTY